MLTKSEIEEILSDYDAIAEKITIDAPKGNSEIIASLINKKASEKMVKTIDNASHRICEAMYVVARNM